MARRCRANLPVCRAQEQFSSSNGNAPFAFDQEAYQQARLDFVKAEGSEGHIVLVDAEASGLWQDGKMQGLVVCVEGDTLSAIVRRAKKKVSSRPCTLDLIMSILEQMQSSSQAWEVQRVAVVAIDQDTYIGRVFFGARGSEESAWDCDIRPSDAVHLSQRSGCPIFIAKSVWTANVMTHTELNDILEHNRAVREAAKADKSPATQGAGAAAQDTGDVATLVGSRKAGVLDNDPERIKMLKRQLAVAVAEEDFQLASQIRDQPAMRLYAAMLKLRAAGMIFEASEISAELQKDVGEPLSLAGLDFDAGAGN